MAAGAGFLANVVGSLARRTHLLPTFEFGRFRRLFLLLHLGPRIPTIGVCLVDRALGVDARSGVADLIADGTPFALF